MAHDIIDLLTEHIDRLRTMHRAGITPACGDVELLFDLNADVKRSLHRDASPKAAGAAVLEPAKTTATELPPDSRRAAAAFTGTAARVVVEGDPESVAHTLRAIGRGRKAA